MGSEVCELILTQFCSSKNLKILSLWKNNSGSYEIDAEGNQGISNKQQTTRIDI